MFLCKCTIIKGFLKPLFDNNLSFCMNFKTKPSFGGIIGNQVEKWLKNKDWPNYILKPFPLIFFKNINYYLFMFINCISKYWVVIEIRKCYNPYKFVFLIVMALFQINWNNFSWLRVLDICFNGVLDMDELEFLIYFSIWASHCKDH